MGALDVYETESYSKMVKFDSLLQQVYMFFIIKYCTKNEVFHLGFLQ